MLDRYFLRPDTLSRIHSSWIGEAIVTYVTWLTEQDYAARTVYRRVPILMRFGAFAQQQGARQWADLPAYIQPFVTAWLKGRVERKFDFVQKNLLNGRTYRNLEHLNEVTAWWLTHVADVQVHRETKQRPIDRYAQEQPHLVPLPAQPYDTAQVLYRIADVEGFVCYQQNYGSSGFTVGNV
jgi:hypothetical protein